MSNSLHNQKFIKVLREMYVSMKEIAHKEHKEGGGAVYDIIDFIIKEITGNNFPDNTIEFSIGGVIAGFLITIARADGKFLDIEKREIKAILKEVMSETSEEVIKEILDYSIHDLTFSIEDIGKKDFQKKDEYSKVKTAMFESACWIAYIDKNYHEEEHKVLDEIQRILDISDDTAKQIKDKVIDEIE